MGVGPTMGAVAAKASRWLSRRLMPRELRITPGRAPVLSMTYDDVIGSACDTGAALLQTYGGRGTFYVAGSLTGGQEDGKTTHTAGQLHDLCRAGHEIASHGWAHQDYTRLRAEAIRADLDRNSRFLATFTGRTAANFAYPFGRYNLTSQLQCILRFRSCRVVGGGVYRHRVDLNCLGSLRLYGDELASSAWRGALQQIADGGWLIVNTHAVDEDCGPYGCRPGDLDALLRYARELGCELLPVEDAINAWQRER